MPDTLPVTLGGLRLLGLEVPTFFDRGGRMRVAIHHVIGGNRVVQVLGADPQKRRLSGCFIGPQAAERGQLLEAMRDAGSPVVLTIGAWTEYVLVTSVIIRYAEKGTVVQYLVEAEPLPASAIAMTTTEATIVAGLLADLSQSSTSLVGAANSPGYLSASQTGLSLAMSSISNSYQGGNQVAADLATPSSGVMSIIIGSGEDLNDVNVSAGTVGLVANASDLTRATSDAQALAAATQSGGYLNRAGASLSSLDGTTFIPVVHS